MIPQLSVRNELGEELTKMDFGTVTTNPSNTIRFRIYNNFEGLEGVLPATEVKVGLTIYENTGQSYSLIKDYESKLMKGVVEIRCSFSSKKGTVPTDSDWHVIEMEGSTNDQSYRGFFESTEFDVINPTGLNYNEYFIRLKDLPTGESGKTYEIFLNISYNWSLD